MEVDENAGVSVHLLADARRALVHVEIMDDAAARKIAEALTTARCVASLRPSAVKRPKPPRKPQ